ncbi:bifunctional 4-hydroxy-2-oxoglutarate aldolase/2-dehydro-3-deoxy-phosphogluconate aldolase [Saccharopolyspora spinosporotrichia]
MGADDLLRRPVLLRGHGDPARHGPRAHRDACRARLGPGYRRRRGAHRDSRRRAVAARGDRGGARRGRPVGAGTVVGVEQLRTATELGAAFTVAPGLDPELVRASELPHLPGVATPSEVQHARKLGLTWVKAFPATVLGTGWFAAIRGPFPGMRFTATGGMNAHTSSPPGRRWAPSGRRWRIPSSCPRCGASSSEGRESASE